MVKYMNSTIECDEHRRIHEEMLKKRDDAEVRWKENSGNKELFDKYIEVSNEADRYENDHRECFPLAEAKIQ